MEWEIDQQTEALADVWQENIPLTCCEEGRGGAGTEGGHSEMTRCIGNTGRSPRLNPNVRNVFFMRAESIVILEMSLWSGNEPSRSEPGSGLGEKRGGRRRPRRR